MLLRSRLRQLYPLMALRIEFDLGNQSVCANSVKPFYKGRASVILQNKVFYL